ncbi:MAG: methyltransferase domain-containing protein [Acidimicrobiales bacterium]
MADEVGMNGQRWMWTVGDYPAVARHLLPISVEVVEAVGIGAGQRVLDVGVGDGNTAIVAAKRGAVVTGVDLTPAQIERARRRTEAEGVAVELREGDAEDLPVDDASFDRDDGRRLWARPGSPFVSTTQGVWWDRDRHLALLDAGTGEVVREVDSPVTQSVQLLYLGDGRIGVVGRSEFAALAANGEVEVLDTLPSQLSARTRWDDGMLLVATWDQAVTAYALEPPS